MLKMLSTKIILLSTVFGTAGARANETAKVEPEEAIYEQLLAPILLSHSECRQTQLRNAAEKRNNVPLLDAGAGVPARDGAVSFLIELVKPQVPAVRFEIQSERSD